MVGVLLLACGAAPARGGEPLRGVSIAGTIGTWGTALLAGWPLLQCVDDDARLSLAAAKDRELDSVTLGASRGTCTIHRADSWSLTWRPTVSASAWKADEGDGHRSAWDAAAVPMLRWRMPGDTASLSVDLGIGAAYLSEPDIGRRVKSTHFQFSDHLGLAVGDRDSRWDVAFVYRHLSNLNIREPNNSVDFKGLAVEVRL